MTAQYAIHELKQVRQYCSARAIPAIDYAIQVLQGLAERERMVEEEKAKVDSQLSGINQNNSMSVWLSAFSVLASIASVIVTVVLNK